MTTQIIALMGAAGSGKTTVSKKLQAYGFSRYRFAGTLKLMLRTLGLTEEQVDGSEKEIPSDLLCGRTPRHAMQTIGTEWRDMIHPHLWTRVLEAQIVNQIAANESYDPPRPSFIVIDDCRFPHEVDMIRRLGGEIWCIRRAQTEPGIVTRWVSKLPWPLKRLAAFVLNIKPLHPSELYWMDIDEDVTLYNNTSEADLMDTVETAIYERIEGPTKDTENEQLSLL
ncbi:deoxynucleotide monophosphate kinase [Rhizobium phage vB_RleS_L338C]|uniref:deoxynucleotide monophosphate kinase n=1 Tax=Rhizobium phage vB_RleS_L338C TaxID=1414737 RepID=UPI0003D80652|nr:deoxynucleotide monophosphate kinase [Rhizobium phage vB_RleS_L338C]AHC30462.1 deoxynucleotide monophosphate kinase [Rhizobium phage vB_RleS_L338C]QNH72070.1 deoxynucleotide monophosphate kinase [Rhizobium phage P11VFA]